MVHALSSYIMITWFIRVELTVGLLLYIRVF